ncbi:MAG: hypothetical protein RIR70_368 [Pseudomonadota bacterium]|jgi:polyhydroxyalkanoate synthase
MTEHPSCGHPLRKIHRQIEGTIDPMGVAAPLVHAQLAWLAHPQELAEQLTSMSATFAQLQWHTFLRSMGVDSVEPVAPKDEDNRFADPIWENSPSWDIMKQWYLTITHQVQDMLYCTPGMGSKERRRAAFWWRKWLNAMAPTNFLFTNPVAMRRAIESNGETLVAGFKNFMDDLASGDIRMTSPEDFLVGKNLATTEGAVVFRNELVEIIHYKPLTDTVHRLPVVIVTPWINKFYVLDLTPKRSMVKYLLEQGFSVFITSWKNPGAEMRETRFDDYLTQGIGKLIETAQGITGESRVHAIGYCIGGTALSMYMAWANAKYGAEHVPVAHWTLFTSLVDFHKPGDIEVFIDEASVSYLERVMEAKGYLDGKEMAGAFRLLRSNSLIWNYVVAGYLCGDTPPPFDVLYWNMDTTRMPARMHSWYLRELYLHNRLIQKNALTVAGESLDLERITQPLYGVGAVDDHIAPWDQCFLINHHVKSPKRFVLSSSGHILGIINPPVTPPKRTFWVADAHRADTAADWRARAVEQPGSWWEDWMAWLGPKCGERIAPPPLDNAQFQRLADAPGTYVLER